MKCSIRCGVMFAAMVLFCSPGFLKAETIVKLNLGATGPDVHYADGVFSTVDETIVPVNTGDQITSVTFHGFVEGQDGIFDITPPQQGTFSLNNVLIDNPPTIVPISDSVSLMSQTTEGGTFDLFDEAGTRILSGTLKTGSLNGTTGTSATGGFFTAILGTFSGPSDLGMDKLFSLVDPDSMSLSFSLTDVESQGDLLGFRVENDVLLPFTADATANISADPVPEPGVLTISLLMMGLAASCLRRR